MAERVVAISEMEPGKTYRVFWSLGGTTNPYADKRVTIGALVGHDELGMTIDQTGRTGRDDMTRIRRAQVTLVKVVD